MFVQNLKVQLLLTLLNPLGWVFGTAVAMIASNGFFGTAHEVQSFYFGSPDAIKSITLVYLPPDQWWWLGYIAVKWFLPVGFLCALLGSVPQWRENLPVVTKVLRPLGATTLLTTTVLVILISLGSLENDMLQLFS